MQNQSISSRTEPFVPFPRHIFDELHTMDKETRFRGKKFYYKVEGSGEPLVLLHGFCEDADVWNGFAETFMQSHTVIRPDFPGYYRSAMPQEALSMELLADSVAAVLDAEGLDKVNLIGHSMGGYVALAFAEQYGERLLRLGLFHSHAYADSEEKQENRKKTVTLIEKHGAQPFIREFHPGLFAPGYADAHPKLIAELRDRVAEYGDEVIIASLDAMRLRPERTDVLRNIKVPVLFILGKEDTAIPYHPSVQQTYLPEVAQVEILEGVGHMGMFEAPEQTRQILKNFLKLRI